MNLMASNVSFFKTSNLSRGFYLFIEKGTLYFLGFLLALSLYALSNESFFLPLIPELSDGLHAMAGINSKSGHSSKPGRYLLKMSHLWTNQKDWFNHNVVYQCLRSITWMVIPEIAAFDESQVYKDQFLQKRSDFYIFL